MRRPWARLWLALLSGWLVGTYPAQAQPAEDLFDLTLEELGELEVLVVSAQRRDESAQDVPVALSVFSASALRDFGVTDTQSLQIVTPGLTYNNTGSSAQPFLRGVGTRFAFAGVEPSVSTYLDDRYIARAQATIFELADVERVEVLKGPQGTLYGRNATGGAIRVITQDVDEELTGKITAGLGDYDLRMLSGTISVPFTKTFGARFSALTKQRDGYADNLFPAGVSQLDDQDYQAFRSKFRWDISSRVTSHLTLAYTDRDDNVGNDIVDLSPPGLNTGIAAGGISGRAVDEVATAITDKVDSETVSADLRFDVFLEGYDFVSITTYSDFEQRANSDADGTSAPVIDAFTVPQTADAFSQELHLVSTGEGRRKWIAGAYYFAEDTDFEILLDVGQADVVSQGDQNAKTTAGAVFGQVRHDFDDAWSLTLGGRWSFEKKKVRVRASTRAPVTSAPNPFDDSASWDEFTPEVKLVYQFSAGMVYASYARGFKSGGYNYAASLNDGKVLNPEILNMVELGWKTELLDKRLRLDGSLYAYDYDDLQVTRAVAGPITVINITENATSADVIGLDLDATWLVTDRLTVTAGINLLDGKYNDYEASANVFNAVLTGNPGVPGMDTVVFDASGEDLLRASDWSGFISAHYEFRAGAGRLPVVVTYSYKSNYQFDFIADPSSRRLRQDGYGLLNARASYVSPGDQWTVSAWVNNLTDEDDYFMDIVANTSGIRGSHGAPRTWGIDVSYRF